MVEGNKSVGMIKGHWATEELAENIVDEKVGFPIREDESSFTLLWRVLKKALNLPEKDVWYNEGHASKIMVVAARKMMGKDFKHIVRANNGFFSFSRFSWSKRLILRFLSRYVDGAIAVSEMKKEEIKENVDIPVEEIDTPLKDKALLEVESDLESKNLISIGTVYPRKGNDILWKVHKKLKEDGWRGKTFVLGNTTEVPEELKNEVGSDFLFEGWQNDISKYFQKSCFYVHPARYDAAACSVLEAMASGLIPLVSEKSGNKKLVRKVSKNHVLGNEPVRYYERLKRLMSLKQNKLESLSNKCKSIASRYPLEKVKADFEKKFWRLVA